jgi:hypothetical protein
METPMPRKTLSSAVLAMSLSLCAPVVADTAAAPELKAQAAGLVQDYASRLKAALTAAMQAQGPEGALEVCHTQAPEIAAEISQNSGWSVARTSLKLRNTASAPDAYERRIMDEFNARIVQGEKPADLVSAEIVLDKGKPTFRFVKAIPTGELCLTCHGETIAPALKQKIVALYPDDQATGFKPGDMRGVFTLKKNMEAKPQ